MTKITFNWQADSDYSVPYDEELNLSVQPEKAASLIAVPPKISRSFRAVLDKLERTATIAVLDECIEKLLIMKCVMNIKTRDSWHQLVEYRSHEERFTLLTPKKRQEFVEQEYEKIPYTDAQKLQKCICFLITTLEKGCEEMWNDGSYKNILNVIFAVRLENEDDEQIINTTLELKEEVCEVKQKLANESKYYIKAIEQSREVIGALKIELDDVYAYGNQELRYLNDWEATRHYQHDLTLTHDEDVYNDTIVKHLTKIEYENRIHNEIENFIEEDTEDLRNSISYWMQEYDDQIEKRDAETLNLKMDWEQLTERHILLQVTYEEHKLAIEDWLAFKEERRKREELERLQLWAAIKIQAWWRGTMVRKKLGPYRKKKKKKGDKGGKKGGGKKGRGKKK